MVLLLVFIVLSQKLLGLESYMPGSSLFFLSVPFCSLDKNSDVGQGYFV